MGLIYIQELNDNFMNFTFFFSDPANTEIYAYRHLFPYSTLFRSQAARVQPHNRRLQQKLDGGFGRTAEFLRQRPVGTRAAHQEAAVDPCAGRGLGQLGKPGLAVESVHPHPDPASAGNVRSLLYRVAERQALGRAPQRDAAFDQIGRASRWERMCEYVEMWVGA